MKDRPIRHRFHFHTERGPRAFHRKRTILFGKIQMRPTQIRRFNRSLKNPPASKSPVSSKCRPVVPIAPIL